MVCDCREEEELVVFNLASVIICTQSAYMMLLQNISCLKF